MDVTSWPEVTPLNIGSPDPIPLHIGVTGECMRCHRRLNTDRRSSRVWHRISRWHRPYCVTTATWKLTAVFPDSVDYTVTTLGPFK